MDPILTLKDQEALDMYQGLLDARQEVIKLKYTAQGHLSDDYRRGVRLAEVMINRLIAAHEAVNLNQAPDPES